MMQRETAAAMEAIADFSSYRQLSQTHFDWFDSSLSPVNPVLTPSFTQR
jgi:hypothetical protein